MTKFDYTPLGSRIHENILKLLEKPFTAHEHGSPEWVKNASDEYMGTKVARYKCH